MLLDGSGGLPPEQANIIMGNLAQSTPTGIDGYPQRFGIPEGLYAEPVAVKQGWFCCWNGGNQLHVSTGVIGARPPLRDGDGIAGPDRCRGGARQDDPGRQDDVPRRARSRRWSSPSQIGSAFPGAIQALLPPPRRRFAWSPDSSTSGTSSPRQLGGLV